MPRTHERLEILGGVTLGEVRGRDFLTGTREIQLEFKLPDGDYARGHADLVDPKLVTPEGLVELNGYGAHIASGSLTLQTDVQFRGKQEVKGFVSDVEILLAGPQNQVVVEGWDALVGKVVDLPELPGQLEVLEWSPEEARFRLRVEFPERVQVRVSDEHVAKSMVSRGSLVEAHAGEWRLRFDTPCPKGTGLRLSYAPEARRYAGRVEVGPITFPDWRNQ